ncbi:MAG: hypothetical protein PHN69_05105 [Candidatus Pacebacteria bacterium]|nr:hypothetical protein [Candidatus Paceibacterota bacterium]
MEEIKFSLVLFLVVSIFVVLLWIAFKKKKAYLTGGLSVKKDEQPILYWLVIFLYVLLMLPSLILLFFSLFKI